ncbi:hypothetical protein O3G_MSEX008766 [Manduca sexta]|nr:hypothetical protein O3G_MSEX008766 [Manduca sexta]
MGFLEERDTTNLPTIPEYYKGKCIFITGGSGFMGKILIEKLLYSCSDLERIYLLMRSKKGVKPEDRLKDLYSIQCFDRLRKEKPDIFMSKVSVISGNVSELGLGLSQEDRALLVDKINIIFHVAASVRFDDPIKYATMLNLRGARELVALAKEVKDLSSLIHVSTSYSNTNRELVEEIMYPPHADWRDTINICETLDEHTLNVLTPKYLGELPNTYTFTKQLAEHVMYEERGRLPIVIMRPSIVISSLAEPMPGWIDNYNGPVGLLVASGKGIMRSLYTDPDMIADYVPVDVCMTSIIVAAWARGTTELQQTDDIPIYNCVSGKLYEVSYKEVTDMGRELARKIPQNNILWHVDGSITTSRTLHYFKVLVLHLLPAVIIDAILLALGRKPM